MASARTGSTRTTAGVGGCRTFCSGAAQPVVYTVKVVFRVGLRGALRSRGRKGTARCVRVVGHVVLIILYFFFSFFPFFFFGRAALVPAYVCGEGVVSVNLIFVGGGVW